MSDTSNQTNTGKSRTQKQRLELTWIGKNEELKLEPRILIEDPEKSYGDTDSENMLIHGDNLLALRALLPDLEGKVRCAFIDPPYNTGSAFEHYDDGIEHSIWLSLMRPRLELIRSLLSDNGSLWITIDDNEFHYLKVLCDEVFGRSNFFSTIVWQHSVQSKNDAKTVSLHHNYVLVYTKSSSFQRNLLPRTEEHNVNYGNPDNDPEGLWRSGDVRSPNLRENLKYRVKTPSGNIIEPPEKGWRWAEDVFWDKVSTKEITFVNNETRVLRKIYLKNQEGRVPESIWFGDDVGTTREASNELKMLLSDAPVFATPKPEMLVQRVLQISTQTGDIVLDSFLGSGTTAAVAHKMKRKWIGVELGEHANTHCLPRLKKVVDGTDGLPLSESLKWEGGGGFKFYNLASSLLRKDKYDNWVIDEKYNANMLAAAMCKHEGFRFTPHEEIYWKQGKSTETDYIFVTTAFVTVEQLDKIHEEMSSEESLLICAKSFAPECDDRFSNITVKKIPQMILGKCEYGQDNYDLNIIESTEEIAEDQDATSNDDE